MMEEEYGVNQAVVQINRSLHLHRYQSVRLSVQVPLESTYEMRRTVAQVCWFSSHCKGGLSGE